MIKESKKEEIRKIKNNTELQKVENELNTPRMLQSVIQGIVKGLTGIVVSDKKELMLSLSHILQRMRGGNFLSNLLIEWNKYVEKGEIKDDYQYTEQHHCCLQELLDVLDKEITDEVRFSVLKKILLVAATEKITDRNSVLPQQYMQIARNLRTGEIIVLLTTYNAYKTKPEWTSSGKNLDAYTWLSKIAKESGLKHPDLVEIHEGNLIKKGLLTQRTNVDRSGITGADTLRLTSLGLDFCEFVNEYEKNN